MIELVKIKKRFKSSEVLKGIDLTIKKGEFISVRGKSGVDKTTLLKITGLLKPQTQGKIVLFRKNIHKQKLPAERRTPT